MAAFARAPGREQQKRVRCVPASSGPHTLNRQRAFCLASALPTGRAGGKRTMRYGSHATSGGAAVSAPDCGSTGHSPVPPTAGRVCRPNGACVCRSRSMRACGSGLAKPGHTCHVKKCKSQPPLGETLLVHLQPSGHDGWVGGGRAGQGASGRPRRRQLSTCGPTELDRTGLECEARGLRRRPGLPRRRGRTAAPSARTMAWPSVEELRLDEVAPPVGSCLFAALHPGTPLGRADALAGAEDFTGSVTKVRACAGCTAAAARAPGGCFLAPK